MNRRLVLRHAAASMALGLGLASIGGDVAPVRSAPRQSADLAALGLPDVRIIVTDDAYEVTPASVPAGWARLTVENRRRARATSADLMRLPEGGTVEGLLAAMADPSAPPPVWLFGAAFAGAPWVGAGQSAQAVVRLSAGEWAVFAPEPVAPTTLTVTQADAVPPDLALEADVRVTLMEFALAGLDAPVPAGRHLWQIENIGALPHFVTVGRLPDGTTQDAFVAELGRAGSGPPAEGVGIGPATLPIDGGCSTISTGQEIFLPLGLVPGTYGAVCFFPDQQTGGPHAMLGMAEVFTVA